MASSAWSSGLAEAVSTKRKAPGSSSARLLLCAFRLVEHGLRQAKDALDAIHEEHEAGDAARCATPAVELWIPSLAIQHQDINTGVLSDTGKHKTMCDHNAPSLMVHQ